MLQIFNTSGDWHQLIKQKSVDLVRNPWILDLYFSDCATPIIDVVYYLTKFK